nr:uncharacterized protein LOC117984669 [Maniola hyperantus]
MSKQNAGTSGQTVRIDMVHVPNRNLQPCVECHHKNRVHQNPGTPKTSKSRSDFVYVNSAFVGSTQSVNENRLQQPPVSVIREQYWACSKWPFATRFLAIAVSVLLGAVISLSILVAMKGDDKDVTNFFDFRTHSAPD